MSCMGAEGEASFPPLIVVIDDDAMVRSFLAEALPELGYRVVVFATVTLFLNTQMSEHLSAVILDAVIPGEDLEHNLERLHGQYPELAVLVSSGYLLEESEHRERLGSAVSFLAKPYRLVTLASRLETLLA